VRLSKRQLGVPTFLKEVLMLAILAAILVVLWLLGFLAFHVSSGLIHILLVLAVVSIVVHLFRGRSVVA
jgi:uncharacterized protein DUF5670